MARNYTDMHSAFQLKELAPDPAEPPEPISEFVGQMTDAMLRNMPLKPISFHPLVNKWVCGVPGCRFLHEGETAARLCRIEWKLK